MVKHVEEATPVTIEAKGGHAEKNYNKEFKYVLQGDDTYYNSKDSGVVATPAASVAESEVVVTTSKKKQMNFTAVEANVIGGPRNQESGDDRNSPLKEKREIEERVSEENEESEDNPPSTEDEARAAGWAPKEEWKGDPSKWRDAEKFLEYGSFFEKIEDKNKRIAALELNLKTMSETFTKSEQRAYKQALKEAEQLKLQSRARNDFDSYEQALKREQDLAGDYSIQVARKSNTPPVDFISSPEFKAFGASNAYVYATDDESVALKHQLDKLDRAYEAANPGDLNDTVYRKEICDYLHKAVRKTMPTFFVNEEKEEKAKSVPKVGAVTAGRGASSKSKSSSSMTISDDLEKEIQGLNSAEQALVRFEKRNNRDWKSYVKHMKLNNNGNRG